eukprot:4255444-Prymnesium_polylepis.1
MRRHLVAIWEQLARAGARARRLWASRAVGTVVGDRTTPRVRSRAGAECAPTKSGLPRAHADAHAR